VLPATLAFDYGSIEALAGYLMQRIPAWVQAPTASGSGNVEEALLRQLPEADLAELLAHELGGI
jgi:hypothetical protein